MLFFFLVFFFFLLPFQFALSPVEGVDLGVARMLAILIVFGWLIKSLVEGKLWIASGWTSVWLTVFLCGSLFSLFFVDNVAWGLRKAVFLLNFIPLYFVVTDFVRNKDDAGWKLVQAAVCGAVLAAMIGFLQFGAQFVFGLEVTRDFWQREVWPFFLGETVASSVINFPSLLVNVGGATLLRVTAFFPDPHMAAYYFGISGFLAVGLALQRDKKMWWWIAGMLFLADALTFSRGGYVGLLAGGAVFLLPRFWRAGQQRHWLRWGLGVLFAGLLLLPQSPIGSRFWSSFQLDEGSNQGRFVMWEAAHEAIRIYPWTGVGLGNFPLFVKPSADYREPFSAHNVYLDIASETGIFTALSFMLMLACGWAAAWYAGKERRWYLGMAAALALYGTHSLFEMPLYSVHILPLLMLVLAMTQRSRSQV